ncbi:uncharacterized protein LOC116110697 isoform X2 [Pistacia vera]|uniref:uncharacterized protein LOC116110697 isoform X2 n=1 Tax=Pistacia vera TaxID=55513 RepID=UPI0012634304|nr:uncharacterized protein LOC116110697 isoform X2 [Pistacia vera]
MGLVMEVPLVDGLLDAEAYCCGWNVKTCWLCCCLPVCCVKCCYYCSCSVAEESEPKKKCCTCKKSKKPVKKEKQRGIGEDIQSNGSKGEQAGEGGEEI